MDVEEGIYMFELLKEAGKVLENMNVKWCFCGGWALDLFMQNKTRPHKDLDIMVFKRDLKDTISYLKDQGWRVEVPTRQGFMPVDVDNYQDFDYENLWCMNENYPIDYLKVDEQGSCTFYQYDRDIQDKVDFMEILLNIFESNMFVYRRNTDIRLAIDKAIYEFEGLPYLAPEIVLLYKSKYLSEDNQSDFDSVQVKLNTSQRMWLKNALTLEYGSDHPWVVALQ